MNNMSEEKLRQLADKWLKGTISSDERRVLDEWYNKQLPGQIEWPGTDAGEQALGERLFNGIEKEISPRMPVIPLYKRNSFRWIAASVLIILCAGILFYTGKVSGPALVKTKPVQDIAPGGNKATLTLADGSTIILDDARKGELTHQSGITVTKTTDGQIVYTVLDTGDEAQQKELHTITTPRGGQYQVSLPDGSRVWLNSVSSLTYPVRFTGNERRVELSGEAYFEVAKMPASAKNGHLPFRVVSAGQEIEVLGTHFNINSYANESATRTTLLEGSIKVTNVNGGHGAKISHVLKPGEEAILQQGRIRIGATNTEQAVAWKNGFFYFNDAGLGSMMRQMERWYDIEVDYGSIPEMHFNGSVSMNVNLSKVIRMLEITGNVKFERDGRKVTVARK